MTQRDSERASAEARLAAKLQRSQEARRAMKDYEADSRRIDEKTARLRAFRLAKEAADAAAKPKDPKAPRRTKRRETI